MTAERFQQALAELLNRIWYDAHPARWLLWPVAVLYEVAVTLRRAGLSARLAWRWSRLSVPVIVVGNISVGGTGKTPFIIWLADQLRRRRLRVGIIARGYRGSAASWPQTVNAASDASVVGDEPVLLARRTSCPVVAGPDRVAAARHLLEHAQVDVLLSDDGLQHYRLARRIEVAVVDGTRGMGNGLCLPAGPLREPARPDQRSRRDRRQRRRLGSCGRLQGDTPRHRGAPARGRRRAHARELQRQARARGGRYRQSAAFFRFARGCGSGGHPASAAGSCRRRRRRICVSTSPVPCW